MEVSDPFSYSVITFFELAGDTRKLLCESGKVPERVGRRLEEIYWEKFDRPDSLILNNFPRLREREIRLSTEYRTACNHLLRMNLPSFQFGEICEANAHLASIKYGQLVLDRLWFCVSRLDYLRACQSGYPTTKRIPSYDGWFLASTDVGLSHIPELPNYRELICSVQREAARLPQADSPTPPAIRSKKSTTNGDAEAKLIGALTKHHRYADGSSLNLEPIGNNELATLAQVGKATASDFFKERFKSHKKYVIMCSNLKILIASLKLLNDEFHPHLLFGNSPANADGADDDESCSIVRRKTANT